MSILIQKPGILTAIQDLGRRGYQRFGINPGGAMDPTALRLSNLLAGNPESEAVIEMHFPAAEIVFETECEAAIAGADFGAEIDGEALDNWRTFSAKEGSILRFTEKQAGNRAYLSIRGGISTDLWLGSGSTNLTAGIGGFRGRRLIAGDRLNIMEHSSGPTRRHRRISASLLPMYRPFPTIRVIPGPEFPLLDAAGLDLLEHQDFTVGRSSNRMGFRLSGKPITLPNPVELVSAAVTFGTIQLLPDGQLVVLMADHQTTGGYPRLAHVISRDLPLVGQLGASDKVAFHLVDIAHAEELAMEFEKDLRFLRAAAKLDSARLALFTPIAR